MTDTFVCLPSELPLEGYAYKTFTAVLTLSADPGWGTCTAAIYPEAANRTAVSGVAMTVTNTSATSKTLTVTKADMTELLGSADFQASYWWELSDASGEPRLSGPFLSSLRAVSS